MNLDLKHPSELNAWQIYRQTKQLAKHTSRAKNPDWYSSAFELGRQWHLWYDGETMLSAVYDVTTKQWHDGPELPEFSKPAAGGVITTLEPADAVADLHLILKKLLAGKEFGGKAKSLGVILHLANDFALTDLASEYAADEDFDAVNELLAMDPQIALGDPGVDSVASAWRALPYWGVHDGERRSTAVQISREHQALITEMRHWGENNNIPVIASAVSAPLEALRLAPVFLDWAAGPGDIILLQYRHFSAFAVLGTSGELVQMRALTHSGSRSYPSGFGDTLVNTAASMNLQNPRVHIVPICDEGTDGLIEELGQFFVKRTPMDVGVIELSEIAEVDDIPGQRPEMLLGMGEALAAAEAGASLLETESFSQLTSGWATQDFYGLSAYQLEVYPQRKDLQVLQVAGMVKMLLLVVTLGLLGWTAFDYLATARTAAWRLNPDDAAAAKVRLQEVAKQNKEGEYWENIMQPRSEGWLVMEMLLNLFPAEAGVLVTDCDYRVVGQPLGKDSTESGYDRLWVIKGYARPEGVPLLGKLSSNRYLGEEFVRIAEAFDSEALRLNPDTRTLTATMQQRQGQLPSTIGLPASVARHYRTAFELSISQSVSEDDTLALTVKPPNES